ncbi:hypothetical protein E1193_13365 [Micromonospora sp. KC606]|uniref:hypothetical protein n=1 Tax=Micromonospora sp. KC606 TaxID=2530379 RepID=UPI0010463BE0|nr:hypothetical protein [Micromonospora sp. KC606]TDC81887.1 hypothetical protein E1193_13365 [Micromonospora sp. KC606]
MTGPSPAAARQKFARDVAVNVLANLIAAAVIYLLAVTGRYIAANPIAVVSAVILLLCGGSGLWMAHTGHVDGVATRRSIRAKRRRARERIRQSRRLDRASK